MDRITKLVQTRYLSISMKKKHIKITILPLFLYIEQFKTDWPNTLNRLVHRLVIELDSSAFRKFISLEIYFLTIRSSVSRPTSLPPVQSHKRKPSPGHSVIQFDSVPKHASPFLSHTSTPPLKFSYRSIIPLYIPYFSVHILFQSCRSTSSSCRRLESCKACRTEHIPPGTVRLYG